MVPGSLTGAGKISDIEGNVNGSIGARDARPDPVGGTLTLNAKAKNSIHLNPGGPVMNRIHRCTVALARELYTTFAKR